MNWDASSQAMDTTEDLSDGNSGNRPIRRSSRGPMDDDEQRERRASIREIMQDRSLTEIERRRSIQSLMDGRRRSSGGASSVHGEMSMMAAAAAAAADFYDSSDEDSMMDHDDIDRGSYEPDPPLQGGMTSNSNSSLSSAGGGSSRGGGSRSVGSRTASERREAFERRGRSASLRGFAAGAAAAAAAAAAAVGDPDDVMATSERMEKSRPKCTHYDRQCTLISPCCGLAFGCRICHDECPVLPPPLKAKEEDWKCTFIDEDRQNPKKRRSLPTSFAEEEVATHHNIDRFAVTEIICRNCYTRQSSKTNNCVNCRIEFGQYHCDICNLWMSADEDPYHCPDCGFCRVGGKKNFRHCHDCGMCIDALLFHDHNCKAGKYMSNCPVCQEDLFSSRAASHEMPCGHAIHWHCFKELTSYDTRCPVCKKTAETPENMQPTWSAMAMGIALQPVPPEMARVVNIVCVDCEEEQSNLRWHFLGVQCTKCGSFNTTVKDTTLMGREAAAFLGDVDAAASHNGTMQHIVTAMNYGAMDEDVPSAQETSSDSTHNP